MITIQTIIEKNTCLSRFKNFLKSLEPINPQIIIIDINGNKDCIDACENKKNIEIYKIYFEEDYSKIRNEAIKKGKYEYQLFMYPWEYILQGWDQLKNIKERVYNISIINSNFLVKEARLWNTKGNIKFINPVYEHLNEKTNNYVNLILSSDYNYSISDRLKLVNQWKNKDITNPDPYYYQAQCLLSMGKYQDFLKTSAYYMHLNKTKSVSSTMNKYYFALVNTYILKSSKPALQNVIQCIDVNPLMAEFWCLAGDIYYHLFKKFDKALLLYDNALCLGKNRKQNDIWPMDISKYEEYPQKMIESCEKIIKNKNYFFK